MLLSILWIDTVDVDPIRLCPSMPPDLDDGVTIIGCRSRDKSVFEGVEGSGKSRGGSNNQSEWSLGEDTLVRDSGVAHGNAVRKLEDNGDEFCGYGMNFPVLVLERGPDVNPDRGEELKGMYRTGDLRIGKEAGLPLCVCSNSGPSHAKGLGIGTGALGGVKPVDPGGLDKVRPDGRPPPGTPAVLEKEDLCRLPCRGFEVEGLLDREAIELLRIAGMTEYITYMNASDVCSEWFHEFLTLKDGI
jgi:hypothetical protein